MGGRKGYNLREVIGDLARIRDEKHELLEGIGERDVPKIVRATVRMLAKSEESLNSLAHCFVFADSFKHKDKERLGKKGKRERKLEISKKWAIYRRKMKVQIHPRVNRDIVDTTSRTLEGKK